MWEVFHLARIFSQQRLSSDTRRASGPQPLDSTPTHKRFSGQGTQGRAAREEAGLWGRAASGWDPANPPPGLQTDPELKESFLPLSLYPSSSEPLKR